MTARSMRLALLTALGAAFSIGLLSAPRIEATTDWINLYIHAGTEMGTPDLKCGWHANCLTEAYGPALDWEQSGEWPAYFRSWAVYSGSQANMSGLASNVTVGETGCFTVRVQVKRPNGTDLGRVHFVHTHGVIGGTFTISAGPLGSAAYTNRAIGDTVTLAEEQCSAITAAHLHQEADSPFAPNGYYPDADENDEGSFQNVDVTSQTKYQHYVAFQY